MVHEMYLEHMTNSQDEEVMVVRMMINNGGTHTT